MKSRKTNILLLFLMLLCLPARAAYYYAAPAAAASGPSFVATNLSGYPAYTFYYASNAYYTTASGSATWVNLTTNGSFLNLTNLDSGTGTKPTLLESSLNGHAVLKFDGVDDVLKANWYTSSQPHEVWVVMTQTNTGSYVCVWDAVYSDKRNAILRNSSGSDEMIYAGSVLGGPAGSFITNKWVVLSAAFNGASSYFYTNNVEAKTGNPGSQPQHGANVGSHQNGSFDWNGNIAMIVTFQTNLSRTTTGAASNLFNWITNMYAISL